jgi:DUF971 family protein
MTFVSHERLRYPGVMRATDIQPIGTELAIRWEDGRESYIALEKLRRSCPCAGCQGEVDILGHLHKGPDQPLPPTAFGLVRIVPVGGYAIQPFWADGHHSGLFAFDYLQKIAAA